MEARKRLGDLLVESGLITPQQLNQVLSEQKETGMKLGDLLIERGYITEQQKIELLEFLLGIPHVQIRRQQIDEKSVRLISEQMAKKYMALPLRQENGKLIVAMLDPLDYYALDELRLSTGFPIEPVIATKDDLIRAISGYFGVHQSEEVVLEEMKEEQLEEVNVENDAAPIVRLVNQTIMQAVTLGASDIHIDPGENGGNIRFRVDGVLRTVKEYPVNMLNVITARLKILGNLNIAERRLPQDGRFELNVDQHKVDIRLSILPTVHGEKVVLRLLDASQMKKDISHLGFSKENYELFQSMIAAPYGLVLITGPTGSGKTTTLYAALSQLNRDDVNIITVEDPVEFQLKGINQVQVNTSTGLTFSNGLRSILRQDPNIIMVGEIRDKETAEMAIRAALTGHLVLSTLHTNNAIGAINRLIDMGVEPFLVSSSLLGVVGQRLVRRICPECKTEIEISPEASDLFATYGIKYSQLYMGKGCVHCNYTGYRGRLAIQEVFAPDERVKRMVVQGKTDSELKEWTMNKGFAPMFVDGLQKVAAGLTTIPELLRVTINESLGQGGIGE